MVKATAGSDGHKILLGKAMPYSEAMTSCIPIRDLRKPGPTVDETNPLQAWCKMLNSMNKPIEGAASPQIESNLPITLSKDCMATHMDSATTGKQVRLSVTTGPNGFPRAELNRNKMNWIVGTQKQNGVIIREIRCVR
jgi:hypothetical protein